MDFIGINLAACSQSRELLAGWFPAGKITGGEFCIGNLRGESGQSLKVNLRTGKWCDFATDKKGGDLISLVAAMRNISQGDAAKELARECGFDVSARPVASNLRAGSANQSANGNGASLNGKAPSAKLTLEDFATAKGLPPEFLKAQGVEERNGRLIHHYRLLNGQQAARQRIRLALEKNPDAHDADGRFIWNKSSGPIVPYGLWKLDEARQRGVRDLIFCEGESDTLTFWSYGMTALGVPGATMWNVVEQSHVTGFKRALIVREADEGGETFQKGAIARLAMLHFTGEVRVVEMGAVGVKDPNELHLRFVDDRGGFPAVWDGLVDFAPKVELPITGFISRTLSEVEIEPITWLWQNKIPLSMLTLFVGHPGIGKSFVSLYIAAQLSRGDPWPDGARSSMGPADTLILSAEDTAAQIIAPRAKEMGADLDRIIVHEMVREVGKDGRTNERSFNLQSDLAFLESEFSRRPNIRVVIIDPVSAYLGTRLDSHNNAEMRSVLYPISKLAERRRISVIAISHFSKGGGEPMQRIAGSIAFGAAARMILEFARDPENPDRRYMGIGKTNIASQNQPALAYSIVAAQSGIPTICWESLPADVNVTEIIRREGEVANDRRNDSRLEEACEAIREKCSDGAITTDELESHMRKLGISEATYRRARKILHIKPYRKGGFANRGVWFVGLPGTEIDQEPQS